MSRADFAMGLAGLYAVCPQRLQEGAQTDMWYFAVSDLDGEAWKAACLRLMQTWKWPRLPPISELRAEVLGLVDPEKRAVIAWDRVREAMRQHGAYCSIEFDDPVIHAAIRAVMGASGWPGLCELDPEELKWRGKDFREAYVAIGEVGMRPQDHQALDGLVARDARRSGTAPRIEFVRVETGLPTRHIKSISGSVTTQQIHIGSNEVKRLAQSFGIPEGTE
jgi:hypothetical protein